MTGRLIRSGWSHLFGERGFPWAVFAGVSVVYGAYSLLRIHLHLATAYDLGIFDQAVWRYAHFQIPFVTLKGDDYTIWADHFHPIIALWAALYWVWDDVRALVVGQALVIGTAAFPVWRFVRRRWGVTALSKSFVVYALAAWPVFHLADFDVHEIAFAVPLVAWVIDAADRRSVRALLISAGLLLCVREDMGVLVFVVGVIWLLWRPGDADGDEPGPVRPPLWFRRRPLTRSDWAVGVGLAVGGLAAFALVTIVIIPHFAPNGYQYWDYPALGSTPAAALQTILTRPWAVVAGLFVPAVKVGVWLLLLIPVGFLSLRSPYALIALPIMAERMLAAREFLWYPIFHYDAPVWIVLALAAVDGFTRLPASWRRRLGARSGVAVLLAWLIAIAGVAEAVHRWWPHVDDGSALGPALAVIPPNTCVAADNHAAVFLTHTNRVTVPGASTHRQDFVVVDFAWPNTSPPPFSWTPQQTYDAAILQGYTEVFWEGTVMVLRAPDYVGPDVAACGPGAR